jgi:ATP-binding cassette, subfamily B, bacterial
MSIHFTQYRRLWTTYLSPLWKATTVLLVVLLISAGVMVLSPQILAEFIDTAVANPTPDALFRLAALYIAAALIGQILMVVSTYLGADIGLQATNRLRADLTMHCLTLDMAFHNARTPGELIERIDGDVSQLNNFFSTFLVQLIRNGILLFGALILLIAVDWRVSAVLTVLIVVSISVAIRVRGRTIEPLRAERETSAELIGFIEERLAGLEDVRANGGTGYVVRRFLEYSRRWMAQWTRTNTLTGTIYAYTYGLYILLIIVGLGMGIALFQGGSITLGAVYLIYRYLELLRRPIDEIGRNLQTLQQAGAAILRIGELLQIQPTITDTGNDLLPTSNALEVRFERVSFRYADAKSPEDWTLRDLDFVVPPGTTLGLLGRTGSGKTTATRLLFRLYDPTEGSIRLGGVDLRNTPQGMIRAQVGLITQDVQLFHATVRHNLTLFDPAIPDEQILTAIRDVGLWAWFSALPKGLDTMLSAGGSGLSAGQAQLLAFVRVFLKNPGLVILDEASSRLDPATEALLECAIDRLLVGRTAIIIAHRLRTLHRADRLLILEQGQCIEYGERAVLEANPDSRFAQLLRAGIEEALS